MEKIKFTIRPATKKDKDTLVDLCYKLIMFENSKNPSHPKETKADVEVAVSKCLKSRKHFFFLAEVDNKPVGFSSALLKSFETLTKKTKGVLDSIWIEPAFRRKGIAKALTEVRLKKLREHKLNKLLVHIRPKNKGSIANIESLGGKHTQNIYTFDIKK